MAQSEKQLRSETRTQRVQKLLDNFMELHNQGYSIPKIAEICGVDFSTVYSHLQEIADSNGVSRDELLRKPGSGGRGRRSTSTSTTTDIKEITVGFDRIEKDILDTIESMEECI